MNDKLGSTCTSILVEGEINSISEIEKSIIKKYRKDLWSPFIKGIKEFDMIQDGDKIAVCVSGGKDSILLAKSLQQLQRYSDVNFELKYIAMDPGFNDSNKSMLINTAKEVGIDLDVFSTEIFAIVQKIAKDYPCYMCARMRRGALYEYAQKIGCNKIALGHHFDDFIETTMLNVLYAGNYSNMMPKLKAKNYDNMELIRPLVYVREEGIIKFTKYNKIRAMNCGCVVTSKSTSSKRQEVKELLKQLRKTDPVIDKSIFSSGKNVNVDSVMGGKIGEESFTFLSRKFQEE